MNIVKLYINFCFTIFLFLLIFTQFSYLLMFWRIQTDRFGLVLGVFNPRRSYEVGDFATRSMKINSKRYKVKIHTKIHQNKNFVLPYNDFERLKNVEKPTQLLSLRRVLF